MSDNTRLLVYAGRRTTTSGPLAYFYANEEGKLEGFRKTLMPAVSIGAQIQITVNEDGAFWIRGEHAPRLVGNLTDDPRLLLWSIAEKEAVVEAGQRREQKRIAKEGADPLKAQLDPIREVLRAMSYERRTATIAWIIQYLQTGAPR